MSDNDNNSDSIILVKKRMYEGLQNIIQKQRYFHSYRQQKYTVLFTLTADLLPTTFVASFPWYSRRWSLILLVLLNSNRNWHHIGQQDKLKRTILVFSLTKMNFIICDLWSSPSLTVVPVRSIIIVTSVPVRCTIHNKCNNHVQCNDLLWLLLDYCHNTWMSWKSNKTCTEELRGC